METHTSFTCDLTTEYQNQSILGCFPPPPPPPPPPPFPPPFHCLLLERTCRLLPWKTISAFDLIWPLHPMVETGEKGGREGREIIWMEMSGLGLQATTRTGIIWIFWWNISKKKNVVVHFCLGGRDNWDNPAVLIIYWNRSGDVSNPNVFDSLPSVAFIFSFDFCQCQLKRALVSAAPWNVDDVNMAIIGSEFDLAAPQRWTRCVILNGNEYLVAKWPQAPGNNPIALVKATIDRAGFAFLRWLRLNELNDVRPAPLSMGESSWDRMAPPRLIFYWLMYFFSMKWNELNSLNIDFQRKINSNSTP